MNNPNNTAEAVPMGEVGTVEREIYCAGCAMRDLDAFPEHPDLPEWAVAAAKDGAEAIRRLTAAIAALRTPEPNGVNHDVSRTEPRPDDLLLRSEVEALCKRKADELAGLVLESAEAGFPKSAREREAMEATATKLRYAIAQMPAARTPEPLKIVPAEPVKLEDEHGIYSTEPKGDAEAMCQRLEARDQAFVSCLNYARQRIAEVSDRATKASRQEHYDDLVAMGRLYGEAAAFIRSLQQRNAELERVLRWIYKNGIPHSTLRPRFVNEAFSDAFAEHRAASVKGEVE